MGLKFEKLKKLVAKITLVTMLATLVPAVSTPEVANAAEDTPPASITLKFHGYGSGRNPSYHSADLGNCTLHTFLMNVEGKEMVGFCGDHTGTMAKRLIGDPWGDPQPFTNVGAKAFMLYYYYHYNNSLEIDAKYPGLTKEQKIEKAQAEGKSYWSEQDREWINGFVQAIVWLALQNKLPEWGTDAFYAKTAQCRDEVIAIYGYGGQAYTSDQAVRDIVVSYGNNKYGNHKFFMYTYKGSDSAKVQPIIIPLIKETITTGKNVYISINKTDNEGNKLAGAKFEVYQDSACNQRIGNITTNDSGVYGPFELDAEVSKTTLYVKEVQPPKGFTGSTTVHAVEVDGDVNNTKETAAKVNHGDAIKNIPKPPETPPAIIQKVDAKTGAGVGVATFEFKGTDGGGYQFQTNASGAVTNIQWNNSAGNYYIPPGTYTVTEIQPPDGYELTTEANQIKLWVDSENVMHHSGQLIFKNYKKHLVKIRKVNEKNEPLEGATFAIYCNGQKIAEPTTDKSGTITFAGTDGKGLKTGYYEFVETNPPKGYQLPYRHSQGVFVNAESTDVLDHELTFVNYEVPEVILEKLDKNTNEPLEGAVFEVQVDGRNIGSWPTGPDGKVVLNYDILHQYLTEGKNSWTISAREVTPPDGYLLDDDNWQTVELIEGQAAAQMTFTDTGYPDVLIKKVDKETGKALPNTFFRILIDGTSIGPEKMTNEKGEIRIAYAEYGRFLDEGNKDNWTITVTETQPPEFYNKDKQEGSGDFTQTAQLKFGQKTVDFTFYDTHYRNVKVVKKDAENGWNLAGATFKLHCVTPENKDAGNIEDRQMTTDETGEVLFENVPNGTYELTEIQPPFGYESNNEKQTFTVTSDSNKVLSFTYQNEPKSGILIRKIDSVTKQPVAKVEFKVTPLTPLTEPSKNYVSDENGLVVIENVKEGTYRIEEVSTVDGYLLNKEPILAEITNQHDAFTFTFENNQTNSLNILKLDSETKLPLAGAVFAIYTAGGSFVKEVTTGQNGYATVFGLKPGSYVVKEVRSPEGHLIDPTPQTFEVKDDDSGRVYRLEFSNSPHSNIYIHKIDANTGIGIEGATFKISLADGTIIDAAAKTDAAGFIHIGELKGGTYQIQEVAAPEGYILDSTVYTLDVKDGQTGNIEIKNNKPGGVAIRKVDASTGEALEGATFELREIGGKLVGTQTTKADGYVRWDNLKPGYYVAKETAAPEGYVIDPVGRNLEVKDFQSTEIEWKNSQYASITITKRDKNTEVPLAGAIFEVRTLNGDVVATLTTGPDGIATSDRLKPGHYNVVETKAPDGYVLNPEKVLVQIKDNEPASVDFFNTTKTGITIHKVDATTEEPLAGAVFEVRTQDDKLVESYTTDQSGTITTKALDPGFYNIVETKAPEGYVLNKEKQTVEVEEGKQSVISIKNIPETVIQIYKTDAVTGDPLNGAEFEILKSNGAEGISLEFVSTDKTGWAYSQVLEPGEYIVKESKAPAGYTLDKTEHRIMVTAGKNAILKLTNAPETSLIVKKIEKGTDKPVPGATFEIRYDTGSGDCTYIGSYTTDAQGMIHTQPLTPGFYLITETDAPDGYVLDSTEHRFCVKAGEVNELVIENVKAATLTVHKIDSKSGKPVAGAVFKLEYADRSDLVGTMETDANGDAIFTNLKEGFYIVTETQAPDGFTLSSCPVRTIQVEYGKNNYIDFKDDQNGSLVIILQDKNTGAYLDGGHFIIIRESDQTVVFDNSTDITGTLVVGNLLPGWYTVIQKFSPDGYHMIDITQKVEIKIGNQQTIYFHDAKSSMVIEKIDAQHPKVMLEGARFTVVRNKDNINVGEFVTGKDGLALTGELEPGMYTVTEVTAPMGYALDSKPQLVHVKSGEIAHATFEDTLLSSITVHLEEETTGKPIVGAKVEVWHQNGELVNSYVSDATGVIQTDKIPAGFYVIKIVGIPSGYVLAANSSTNITVELKNGIEVTQKFVMEASGNLKVLGVDQNDKPIAGITAKVTTIEGTLVGEVETEADGTVLLPSLKAGWYVVTPVSAPDGYELNSQAQNIEVKSNAVSTVKIAATAQSKIQVNVVDQDKKAIAGATVEVHKQNGSLVKSFKTDSTGSILTDVLASGHYVLKLVTIPDGYTAETKEATVELKVGSNAHYTFEVAKKGSLTIVSKDDKGNIVPGVTIKVMNASGVEIGSFTTEANGQVIIPNLVNGNYVVKVVNVPSGYEMSSTVNQNIVVNSNTTVSLNTTVTVIPAAQSKIEVSVVDQKGNPINGAIVEILKQNGGSLGTLKTDMTGIVVTDKLESGHYVLKLKTVPDGYITDVTEAVIKLENGTNAHYTFEVAQKGSLTIVSKDEAGKLLPGVTVNVTSITGIAIGDFTTGSNGQVVIPNLANGTYIIKVVNVPKGYEVASQVEQKIEINSSTTAVVNATVTILPVSQSKIDVKVVDGANKPVAGVTVEVHKQNGGLVTSLTTDKTGIVVTDKLASGHYVLKLVGIPDGYTAEETEATVKLETGSNAHHIFELAQKGSLTIVSKDDKGNIIPGVTVKVINCAGKEIGTFITGENGQVVVNNLVSGAYTIKVVTVPEGYEVSGKVEQRIEVNTNTTVTLNTTVTVIPASQSKIEVSVVDQKGNPINGATVEILKQNGGSLGTLKTDMTGIVVTDKLESGHYVLKLKTVPDGYITDVTEAVIKLENGTNAHYTFEVAQKGSLTIVSKDDAGKILPGVTVNVTSITGIAIGDFTTGSNGQVVIPNLANGTYIIKVVNVPKGYEIASQVEQKIEINSSTTAVVNATVTILPVSQSKIDVKVVDGANKPVAGVTVEVHKQNGGLVTSLTTDKTGIVVTDKLASGHYVLKLVGIPDGYTAEETEATVKLETGSNAHHIFELAQKGSLTIVSKDDKGNIIPGVTVQVINCAGKEIGTFITGENGQVVVNNLVSGAYTIKVVTVPEGYEVSGKLEQRIEVNTNTTVTLNTTVTVIPASQSKIEVSVVDQKGNPINGATVEILKQNGGSLGTLKTDMTGIVVTDKLTSGHYILKLKNVPDGYVTDVTEAVIKLETGTNAHYTFEVAQKGSLTLVSKDEAGKILPGVTVNVTSITGVVIGDFTTESNGQVVIPNLVNDTYIIKVINVPKGYEVASQVEQRVEINTSTTAVVNATVTILPVSQSKIDVKVVDSANKPVAGATVEVYKQNGGLVTSLTTDKTGVVVTDKLASGHYVLKLVGIPDGYTATETEATVKLETGSNAHHTFAVTQKGTLTIVSKDDKGNILPGVTVKVTNSMGVVIGTYTTEANGQVIVNNLVNGKYTVTVVNMPNGYEMSGSMEQTVEIQTNVTLNATVTIQPVQQSKIHVNVVDQKGTAIVGAIVEVYKQNGGKIASLTTDKTGAITTDAVSSGYYVLKLVKYPDGYTANETEATVKAITGIMTEHTFTLSAKGILTIVSQDTDHKNIAGVTVEVTTMEGTVVGTYTTQADGTVVLNDLLPGWYIVKAVSGPNGYQIDNTEHKVNVKVDASATVTITSAPLSNIVVKLVEQGTQKAVAGATVEIRNENNVLIGSYTSDTTGTISTDTVPSGKYTIKVVTVPEGYTAVSTETTVTVTGGVPVNHTFEFTTLSSLKVVSQNANGEVITGVSVKVTTMEGITVGTFTTGADGTVVIPNLKAGWYKVVAVSAPNGYAINTEVQNVEVKVNAQAVVTITSLAQSNILINTMVEGTRTPLSGVVVEVWQQNGSLVNTFTSDSTGVIKTDQLPAGYYVLKVVSVPAGFTAVTNETTISVKDGAQVTYTFEFTAKGILKIMSVNNTDMAIAGMKVVITTLDGTNVGTYTTGKDGSVIVSDLAPGWYIVKEIQAPDGYVISQESEQRIEVKSNGQAEVVFRHGQIYGLQIVTTCQQTGEKVAGATYEIRKMDGAIVGTYESDNAGLIFAELAPGWYTVKPVSAPEGYTIPDENPRNIQVKADGLTTTEFVLTQMSSIRVKVVDGTTQKPIYNVRLQLKNGNNCIKEYFTDNEGYIELDNTITNGKYKLEMISAPDGYVVDTVPKSIATLVGQTTEVVWAIYKEGGQIQVVITSSDYNKTLDKQAGSPLQGAVFEIMNADTYQVVGQMISNASGVAASAPLPIGRYMVKEITAPAYYALSDKEVEVRLKINNDVVRTEFTNQSANIWTAIGIQSNKTVKAGSNIRVDFTAAKNGGDTRLDNFFVHIKVPTDSARMTTLSTGTWSHSVFYSISYKTNMNDYRQLASNLNSTQSYQYSLATQSLGLMSGEYVTDLRMEFGTVPAQFIMKKKACFSEYVLATVPNGYKLINRVECGGQFNTVNVSTIHIDNDNPYSPSSNYVIDGAGNAGSFAGTGSAAVSGNSGTWNTASGLWTTTVTSNVKLPKKLPKTGY